MLKFSFQNSKLNELAKHLNLRKKQVVGFDLPAGYTCKMADICKTFANRKTGKIRDAKSMQFRCYAAGSEARFPDSRKAHWHNYDLLKGLIYQDMVTLINASLPAGVKVVRIHSSGDYFSKDYFAAWVRVAYENPDIIFFGYTKYLNYVRFAKETKLKNFKLVYSYGGKMDNQVTDEPTARVVNSSLDGRRFHVPVACVKNPADDYNFILAGKSFAIALHGTQPHGTFVL